MNAVNIVNQRYLVPKANHFFCADITHLGMYKLFLLVDLASRAVVGHQLMQSEFTSDEIVQFLRISLAGKIICGKTVLHTDNQAIFKSSVFLDFAEQVGLQLSKGPAAAHQNQVVERLNRTIKSNVRHQLVEKLNQLKPRAYLTKERLDSLIQAYQATEQRQFPFIVEQAIEQYNNKPHRAERMFRMSPAIMEEALFTHSSKEQTDKELALIAANDNSPKALSIAKYKAEVSGNYAGSWMQFFVDFEQRTSGTLKEIKEQNVQLALQNKSLYEQNGKFSQQLAYMESRERQRETMEAEKLAKKTQRKKAQRQPVRDAVTLEEFYKILNVVEQYFKDPLTKARVKLAITLLYYTGLRISNLLLLRGSDLEHLIEEQECQLRIMLGGEARKMIYIGDAGQQALKGLLPEISVLQVNQPNKGASIFSSKFDQSKPISQRTFREQVNGVLVKASGLLDKHIRSHSFRATFVTDLLEAGLPIEKAKDVIGHAHIGTTATYRRSRITIKELRRIVATVDSSRKRNLLIKEPKSRTRRIRSAAKKRQDAGQEKGPIANNEQ